jgi:hypothetical protein
MGLLSKGKKKEEDKGSKKVRGKKQTGADETLVHDPPGDGDGHKEATSDDIEAMMQYAVAHGYQLKTEQPRGNGHISEEAKVELLHWVFDAKEERMPELTYLTVLQAHLLACEQVLEVVVEPCDPTKPKKNLYKELRQAIYRHRRSVERWLPMQALTLAGMQEEEKALDSDLRAGGGGIGHG